MLPVVGIHGFDELLLLSEGVAEVAAVAVRARNAVEDHAADLGLVTGVAEDRPQLGYAVGELAVVSIRASSGLLPFVAELSLEHALIVHLKLQCLFLLSTFYIHLLLHIINFTP